MTIALRLLPVAALLLTGACAEDYAQGQSYAPPGYGPPPGYDNSGYGNAGYDDRAVQQGDLFGGQNVQTVEAFFEPLAPYGQWVDSRWGRAFLPNAPQGWRPYVNGRWGENRLWISDDPWGWATDHYGRWGFDDRINAWVWVPGTEWAPSWVAWREADDVTGWAPIPPGVSYSISVGFGGGWGYDNYDSWYQPSWVWVPRTYLYQPHFGGRVLPWNNGSRYWGGSRWNWNSGWNGRPGYNRPGGWHYGDHGNDWHGRPGDGRPGDGRPGGYPNGGYPGGNRPNSVGGAIGGSIAGVPPRPGYNGQGYNGQGYNNGGYKGWQGNAGRPDGQNGQGRPGGGQWQGQRPGYPVQQPAVGGAIAGGIAGQPSRPAYPGYRPGGQSGALPEVIRGNELGGRPPAPAYTGNGSGGFGRPQQGGNGWQGRPTGQPAGQSNPGGNAWQGGRPASVGGAIAGGMAAPRPMPSNGGGMPQFQRPAAPPPSPPPQRSSGGGNPGGNHESHHERPQ